MFTDNSKAIEKYQLKLGVVKANPLEYQAKYGDSLLPSDKIPAVETKNSLQLASNDDTQ